MLELYCKSCLSFPEDRHIVKKETRPGTTEEPPEYEYYCQCGAELSEEETFICEWCGKVELEEHLHHLEENDTCLECWEEM